MKTERLPGRDPTNQQIGPPCISSKGLDQPNNAAKAVTCTSESPLLKTLAYSSRSSGLIVTVSPAFTIPSSFKIRLITKILANRLAKRLNELVSPIQSAFIKGRFIQDNFMLVQQTARLFHQQKLPCLLLKLDITKAFDSVSWPFLIEVMQQIGFGHIWRDIVCRLLASSTTQVLLNGSRGNV